jgi:hypothetical protein
MVRETWSLQRREFDLQILELRSELERLTESPMEENSERTRRQAA